jgi:hypothetical protein
MTATERQQRRRDRIKAARPRYALNDEMRLRQDIRDLIAQFQEVRKDFTDLDAADVLANEEGRLLIISLRKHGIGATRNRPPDAFSFWKLYCRCELPNRWEEFP